MASLTLVPPPDPPPAPMAAPVRMVLDRVGLDFLCRSDPAFIADAAGCVIWANEPGHDFLRRLELPGDDPAPTLPWPAVDVAAAGRLAAGPFIRQDRMAVANCTDPVQSEHWPAFADDGSFIGWAACVAEPSQADRLRRQNGALQERLDDLTRLVSDWIWESGADLTLSFVSPRVGELLGYHPREMLGRPLLDFGHFVDGAGRPAPSPLDAVQPRPFRDEIFMAVHAGGNPLQFRLAALPVFDPESGGFRGFRGTARDVTAEAAALTLVAKSRSQLSHAIDSISEGFALFDAEERLVLCNQKYLDSFPLTGVQIRPGQLFADIRRRAFEAGDIIATPSTEQIRRQSLATRARALDAIEWEISGERWIRAADRMTPDGSIVGIRTDITEWKHRERALYDAKESAERANRTKSEFLANISHELRTPLNAIIGFSELIVSEAMGPIGNAQYKDYLNDVLGSGRHLLDVINDIIDLARAEAGRLELNEEPTDLAEAANAVLRIMRERAMRGRLQLGTDLDEDLPPIQADPRKLRQILTNLVSNAIKFTREGGAVTVAARREAQTGDVLIQVIDTGIGIAADDIPTAFKPFGQIDARLSRQYEGTGLGLPLTKVMVELHQGRITIDSAVGIGTTVTVRLPASRARE
jgi:signal transduction histidine kinase